MATARVDSPTGPAVELVEDEIEDLAVDPVETFVVHLEEMQGLQSDVAGDAALMTDLGEVAHPPQQAVGDARRTARAQSQLVCTLSVDAHRQDVRPNARTMRPRSSTE